MTKAFLKGVKLPYLFPKGESNEANQVKWKESYLYGSDRIGSYEANMNVSTSFVSTNTDLKIQYGGISTSRQINVRTYELKDHLGNVRAVIGDYKTLENTSYVSSLKATSHYYPFGLELTNKQYTNGEEYRYGFNGKESDREWGTAGLTQDYGFRLYNPNYLKGKTQLHGNHDILKLIANPLKYV